MFCVIDVSALSGVSGNGKTGVSSPSIRGLLIDQVVGFSGGGVIGGVLLSVLFLVFLALGLFCCWLFESSGKRSAGRLGMMRELRNIESSIPIELSSMVLKAIVEDHGALPCRVQVWVG